MWKTLLIFSCSLTTTLVGGLVVGDPCSVNNENGRCTLISECPIAVRAIRAKHSHQLPRCGFQDATEIVCCPPTTVDYSQELPTRNPIILNSKAGDETTRPANRMCKKIIDSFKPPLGVYILGGDAAEEGEFPHMVALGFPSSNSTVFKCGGSLISNRYVLTAAHCAKTLELIQPSLVRVGVLNIAGSEWNDVTDYTIEHIVVHPNYQRSRKYHDLALLRLAKPVRFSQNVFPACLYSDNLDPTISLTVTGWGVTDVTKAATSNILLKAVLRTVPRELCNNRITKTNKLPNGIVEQQLCAGNIAGTVDTCQGDSGGPLQGLTGSDGHYRIVGITSFGSGCGSSIPGIYTRVSKYLAWIEDIVWPDN